MQACGESWHGSRRLPPGWLPSTPPRPVPEAPCHEASQFLV